MRYLKSKTPAFACVVLIFLYCLLAVLITGCASESGQTKSGALKVVTTTTMLADAAEIIGGDYLNIVSLMEPGSDPHLYQPGSEDVKYIQEAAILIYNGLRLEENMSGLLGSLSWDNRYIVCIEDGIGSADFLELGEGTEQYDPHVWFSVPLWRNAVVHLATELMEADPDHAEEYWNNLHDYLKELDELDLYIQTRVEELPESQRVLVTAHDAFSYFGEAYGFTTISLQGPSTATEEAGTAAVRQVAQFIVQNEIKAIFIESSVSPQSIEALQAAVQAQGFDVAIVELYSDSLGDGTSGANTYVSAFKSNIDTIIEALK